jgi:pilus assembly protein TadC
MGPKTKAALWVALAMALYGAPMYVLAFFPLKPLWLHVTLGLVLSTPGFLAMLAAWKNYHKARRQR